jgi:SAM-dependent methyltransferase
MRKLKAFDRRPRLPRSTPELDSLEVDWWDSNATHIERIWGLPDPLCRDARQRYIEDIQAMFLRLRRARPLRILEIACGSGWPGRLLASSKLKVTGIDFSEGQIQIARAKAAEAGQTHCDYAHMDINQMSDTFQSNQFNGAFIHCGIHHLSTAELISFSEMLALSPKGFPTILVEPVYLDQETLPGRLLEKTLTKLCALLPRFYLGHASQDETLTQTTDRLIKLADDNGWFLSPKEVPFDVDEIGRLFSSEFEIREIAPVTYFGLPAAQLLATVSDQKAAWKSGVRILRILTFLDRLLANIGILPKLSNNYMFCRIVLIRK